jgi:hypothetical protein
VPSLNDPTGKLSNYTVSKNNGKLTVNKRQARVVYNGQNFASRSTQGSETINLSANVSRLPNDTSGDITKATVEFHIKYFNGSTLVKKTAPVTLNPDGSGTAVTTASVPTSDDPYTIEVQIDTANNYWTSAINGATTGITDIGTLQVIFGTATGRTAGGGWIPDQTNAINGRSNFGFTVANSKTGLRGNHVYIYRAQRG